VDEETFNMSVRKFLKKLGVTAQREIELAVREQVKASAGVDVKGARTLIWLGSGIELALERIAGCSCPSSTARSSRC
jgi:hypothetical protein